MRKGDILWISVLGIIIAILLLPLTHDAFVKLTTNHPFIGGFIKFFILATMGELLAIRIASGNWNAPRGLIFRALIWGFLGMVIVLIFGIYASGVSSALQKGLLPGKNSSIAFAFFTSSIMNLTFAPTMMAFHRITDTYIDLKYDNNRTGIKDIVTNIDWNGFISFVILKTIPLFWIPAHTITFLLPPEYRVLVAAFLSIALGAILAFGKRANNS